MLSVQTNESCYDLETHYDNILEYFKWFLNRYKPRLGSVRLANFGFFGFSFLILLIVMTFTK